MWLAAVAVWLAAGCSSSPSRPPPPGASSSGTATPLSCSALVDAGALNGKQLWVDGGQAACAAEGLQCPLPASDQLAVACGSGASGYAVCASEHWVLRCRSDAAAPRDAAGEAVPARDAALLDASPADAHE